MHVLNFLVAIILPYIGLFSKLAPPESIPSYFFSEEAAFLAGEFNAIIFYWAGFLRNYVASGDMTERKYSVLATITFVFLICSKIIFTLPYSWITSVFAFGLGVLAMPPGQTISKFVLALMTGVSIVILSFCGFILIGMAWYGFTPPDYYYYKYLFLKIA